MKNPERNAWNGMKHRCYSTKSSGWRRYGGRGISVCKRWMVFENFLADMGPRPSIQHSLDRINNDGNYEPGNCRWADRLTQQNNRGESHHRIKFNGQTRTLTQWARIVGISPITLRCRIGVLKWPIERAFALKPFLGNQSGLSEEQVHKIISAPQKRGCITALAKQFGIGTNKIWKIRTGRAWKHVNRPKDRPL